MFPTITAPQSSIVPQHKVGRMKQPVTGDITLPCLIGRARGQPLPGDRPNFRTSQLIAFDIEQGWARTWSRVYRLDPSSLDVRRH
jgi:hypothetical protein